MDDKIVDLANRTLAKRRAGEEWESEFAAEFAALTDEEREELQALLGQRAERGQEVGEAMEGEVRAFMALSDLIPTGTTLGKALVSGQVTVKEVVQAVRNA